MFKTILRLAVTLLGLLVATTANAGQATELVKSKQAQLFKVIVEAESEARQAKLNQLFDEMIAYDQFAARSLGDKWSERSEAERQRFSALLTELVRANYRKNIKKLLDFDVSYVKEGQSEGATVVTSLAKHKTNRSEPEVEVEFKLEASNGSLKVVDIVTEKASMVRTFRRQFLKVLDKDGFDALIAKMQKKLDKLNKKKS